MNDAEENLLMSLIQPSFSRQITACMKWTRTATKCNALFFFYYDFSNDTRVSESGNE